MSMFHQLVAATALLFGAASASQAQVLVPLGNPSFESDFANTGTFPVLTPAGWTVYDPGSILGTVDGHINVVGVLNPGGLNPPDTTFFVDPVPHGSNVALVYLEQFAGTETPGDPVGLESSFDGVLALNTHYTLSVAVGNIASGTGLNESAGFGYADLSGFPGYRVELLADGQIIAFDHNGLASIGEGRFMTSVVELTVGGSHALAGSVLGVRVINLNTFGNVNERGREVDFDNIQLMAAPVPEPSDYAMWLAGLGLLWGLRSRRRLALTR